MAFLPPKKIFFEKIKLFFKNLLTNCFSFDIILGRSTEG